MLKFILSFVLIPCLIFSEIDFCVFTCPKCGTHLIINIMNRITNLNPINKADLTKIGESSCFDEAKISKGFIFTHTMYDSQIQELIQKNYKFIFLYRDPRDQLISALHWMPYVTEIEYPPKKIENTNALINELITGSIYGMPMYEHAIGIRLEQAKEIPREQVLMIKFEDLTGLRGGGNLETQIKTIMDISSFLNLPITPEMAQEIGEESWGKPFGGSSTFRKGRIGQWKDHLTPEHIQLYKDRYGQLLIEMGYEKDLNW